MKLGQQVIDPLTGKRGYVVRYIDGQAIARDEDGNHFKAGHKTGRQSLKGHPCRIKVKGVPGDWMLGVRVDGDRAKVTDGNPVWQGVVLSHRDAKIEPITEDRS